VTHPGPLVELLDAEQAPLLARRFYGDGAPSPITSSLAQVPELLEVVLPFIGVALGPVALDLRAKEIAVLRTSALLECRYCVRAHTVVALDAGLTLDEVLALRDEGPVDGAFPDERERTMIAWIDAVALGRGPVDPDVQARAADALEDHELVELTMAVTAALMLNRYCTALDLPTSPQTEARLAAQGIG
jgi:AhpD family alkylhydroperoxidase